MFQKALMNTFDDIFNTKKIKKNVFENVIIFVQTSGIMDTSSFYKRILQ